MLFRSNKAPDAERNRWSHFTHSDTAEKRQVNCFSQMNEISFFVSVLGNSCIVRYVSSVSRDSTWIYLHVRRHYVGVYCGIWWDWKWAIYYEFVPGKWHLLIMQINVEIEYRSPELVNRKSLMVQRTSSRMHFWLVTKEILTDCMEIVH